MGTPRHIALLYRNEEHFIESASSFFRSAPEEDATILAIVTAKHRQDLSALLGKDGYQSERILYLDASDCLRQFMVDGWPDEPLFTRTMDALIGPTSKRGPVRVLGEMVAVLCNEGKAGAAIRLEELWNIFVNRHNLQLLCANLQLLCAYPLAAMYGAGGDQIRPTVCELHQRLSIK